MSESESTWIDEQWSVCVMLAGYKAVVSWSLRDDEKFYWRVEPSGAYNTAEHFSQTSGCCTSEQAAKDVAMNTLAAAVYAVEHSKKKP